MVLSRKGWRGGHTNRVNGRSVLAPDADRDEICLPDHRYPSLEFRAESDMNGVLNWPFFRSRASVGLLGFGWICNCDRVECDPHSILAWARGCRKWEFSTQVIHKKRDCVSFVILLTTNMCCSNRSMYFETLKGLAAS